MGCAASGTRTRTAITGQGILSPSCLPIPPLRLRFVSGKRDSNSRPRPWQGRALPTELFPHFADAKIMFIIVKAKLIYTI